MKKLLLFTILIFALFISAFNTASANTISYLGSPFTYTQGVTISNLTPDITGTVSSVTVSPSLPTGLSINATTGVISGTPTTTSSATDYTITVTFSSGTPTTATTTINITVVLPAAPVISYSSTSYNFIVNSFGTTSAPTNTGGAATSWTISPTLPSGLSFALDTSGTISGTPTATKTATTYTITASNAGGSSTTTITITVSASGGIYDWTGSSKTNSNWTNAANWNYNGTTASNYPGQSGTTDIVRFGEVTSFSNSPTLSSNLTIASVQVGAKAPNNFTLTLSGATLSLTGNFTLDDGSGSSAVKAALAGTGTSPLLSIGGDFYGGSNATFTNSGCPITIYGNFTNYSKTISFGTALLTFNVSNGKNQLRTSKAVTFNNVKFTGNGPVQLQHLTGNAGIFYIASTGTMEISGTNTNVIIASGKLTLRSDASGSATLKAIPSGCQITGTVGVERYISGTRGWRLLTSPVHASTNTCSLNYLQNSIYISGSIGTAGGFDVAGYPSLFLYREDNTPDYGTFANTNYRAIASLLSNPYYPVTLETGNFSVPQANGYQVFIRGDRSTGTVSQEQSTSWPFTSVTLTASGTINQQSVTFKSWYTGASTLSFLNQDGTLKGFNLVGNPYPSSIDWDLFSNSDNTQPIYGYNVSTTIYSYNFIKKQYAVYQTGTPGGVGTNGSSHVIGSGQGFFAVATGGSATLTFNESAKTSSSYIGVTTLMSKQPITASVIPMLRLKMALDTINSDETIILFDNNAKSTFDVQEDAPYKPGEGKLSLNSLSQDSVAIAINHLPLKGAQPVRLNIGASANGTYILDMEALIGLPKMYDVWLKDAFVGDSVNLRTAGTYSFTIDKSNAATFGSHRFSIIVKQDSAYAYKLLNFTANRIGNSSHVQTVWNTLNEEDYTNFTVERSNDGGNTFAVVGGIQGTGAGAYSLTDKNAMDGQNIYRLKSEDINNIVTYSQPVDVMIGGNGNSDKIQLYPNPATSVINLDVLDKTNGASSYSITVSNSTGFIVKQVTSSQPKWQANVSDLMPGTYIVRVIDNKAQSFIGEGKFIKL